MTDDHFAQAVQKIGAKYGALVDESTPNSVPQATATGGNDSQKVPTSVGLTATEGENAEGMYKHTVTPTGCEHVPFSSGETAKSKKGGATGGALARTEPYQAGYTQALRDVLIRLDNGTAAELRVWIAGELGESSV